MILEAAFWFVNPAQTDSFARDFAIASQDIASIEGSSTHSLPKCLELPYTYLLLAWWQTLKAHTVGFRRSEAYLHWKPLLPPYYDYVPFPAVEHFEQVYPAEG